MKKQKYDAEMDLTYKYIQKLTEIGLALSSEKNITKLLEMIVTKAREMSNADAGTLYIMDKDKKHLSFKIIQNNSLNIQMGGTGGEDIKFPPVPLEINGKKNMENVCTYAAITGESINISDIYDHDGGFDFIGAKKYDAITGYETKSMLVIPLKNNEEAIIGVLQLINSYDPEKKTISSFLPFYEKLVKSIASQAAVALTNAQLIQSLHDLLFAFIQSMAVAIDEKSPYTGGHIKRVVDISMLIAKSINESKDTIWKDTFFNHNELQELQLSAWMHDIGKIVTPEHVIDKATKLEKNLDRIEIIELRFQLIEALAKIDFLAKKEALAGKKIVDPDKIKHLEKEFKHTVDMLKEDLNFIKSCNNTGDYMSDDKIETIKAIGEKKYFMNHQAHPFLHPDEIQNLCIRKGTLTDEERLIVENHARLTYKITSKLPFPDQLARIPEFASSHHERPDGTGYPNRVASSDLAVQSRILAVADIFEALTAVDRPYRKPMKLSEAIQILDYMSKDNHIDSDIFHLFIKTGIHKEYARKELNPEQVDIDI
ncbi:MAG: HD domain-containing phosphohydrolase [Pseudomonadota bacterium]